MKKRGLIFSVSCLLFIFVYQGAFAAGDKNFSSGSTLIISEGYACLGEDSSREEAKRLAYAKAKRTAAEQVVSEIQSSSTVQNGMLSDDVIQAYSKAKVSVLDELEKGWRKSPITEGFVDDCYYVKIKAEVQPHAAQKDMGAVSSLNPAAPLTIALWTDKQVYRLNDMLTFYFTANKPCYVRAVYKDAEGNLIEVTPYTQSRYYVGGATHQIPAATDTFSLKVTPPLGSESLILYASTKHIDPYEGSAVGGLYVVNNKQQYLGSVTRGLTVLQGQKHSTGSGSKAEFAEVEAAVTVVP